MEYPVQRNLDGYYFRVQRDDKWENICLTDLTEDEMNKMLEGRPAEWLRGLCVGIVKQLRDIGDELDIEMVYDDGYDS